MFDTNVLTLWCALTNDHTHIRKNKRDETCVLCTMALLLIQMNSMANANKLDRFFFGMKLKFQANISRWYDCVWRHIVTNRFNDILYIYFTNLIDWSKGAALFGLSVIRPNEIGNFNFIISVLFEFKGLSFRWKCSISFYRLTFEKSVKLSAMLRLSEFRVVSECLEFDWNKNTILSDVWIWFKWRKKNE